MKKIGYLACLVVGLMFLVNAQSYAKDPDEEVSGLLQRIILLSAKMHQQGYTIVHIEVDKLEQGQKYMTSRRLFNDNHYKIAGIGGVGISDLDMFHPAGAAISLSGLHFILYQEGIRQIVSTFSATWSVSSAGSKSRGAGDR